MPVHTATAVISRCDSKSTLAPPSEELVVKLAGDGSVMVAKGTQQSSSQKGAGRMTALPRSISRENAVGSPSLSRSISRISLSEEEIASMRLASFQFFSKPSLLHFGRLHSGCLGPVHAHKCLQSMNGRALVLPSSYLAKDNADIASWDVAPQGLPGVYLRALATWRGVCTLLCLTDIVVACDQDGLPSGPDCVFPQCVSGPHLPLVGADSPEERDLPRRPPASNMQNTKLALTSAQTSALRVDQRVLDYLIAYGRGEEGDIRSHGDAPRRISGATCDAVKLVRRFEYHFRLTGARALILHFKSVTSSGEAVLDAKGHEILHVVEVSEDSVSPLLLRGIAVAGLVGAAALLLRR